MQNIKLSPSGGLYKLCEAASVTHKGITVTVPEGFKYDGASIPEPFWQAIGSPFYPAFMRGALFHDYLYGSHEQSKEFSDELFHALLLEDGIGEIKAAEIYEAVHLFGKMFWDAKG